MSKRQSASEGPAPAAPPAPDAASERRAKNRNLAQRVGTALVLLPVVLWLIYLGGLPLACLAGVAAMLNAVEFSAMSLGDDPLRVPAALAAFAMPFFFVVPSLGAANLHWLWAFTTMVILAWRLLREAPVDTAGRDVSAAVTAAVYGSLVGYVVPLRTLGGEEPGWGGGGWVLLACVLTWGGDTGAYFAGRFLGRHKLYPRISPAKTWEGFFGGMATGIVGAFIVRHLVLQQLTPVDCVVLGVICGIGGPLGDLAESMLKRSYKVKDSGSILPGHGGMLDRVDALMINAPIVYFYAATVVQGRG